MDLAVAALVKAEELEATAEEIEAEMKSVADKYGMDLDTIKKYLPEADVREQVLRSKAIKAVADAAVAVAPVVEETKEEAKQEKRIEMLESYDTYTYMKKRWEKYVRKQGIENVSWETVLHRIVLFLRPVWNAMCRDEVFFGDWMPDLERYL